MYGVPGMECWCVCVRLALIDTTPFIWPPVKYMPAGEQYFCNLRLIYNVLLACRGRVLFINGKLP